MHSGICSPQTFIFSLVTLVGASGANEEQATGEANQPTLDPKRDPRVKKDDDTKHQVEMMMLLITDVKQIQVKRIKQSKSTKLTQINLIHVYLV